MIALINLDNNSLNHDVLKEMRDKHDSQVGRKKGNERKKQQPPILNNLAAEVDGQAEKLNPSECSKIVASIVKNAEGLEKAVARLHRWNIHIPLKMHRLMVNSTSNVTIATQNLLNNGSISPTNPLEPGKFVVLIKNHVSLKFISVAGPIDIILLNLRLIDRRLCTLERY